MSLWRPPAVDDEPTIVLTHWAIFKLPNGDLHFAGTTRDDPGRASSRIVSWDPATRSGVTRSGRVYQLQGEPGLSGDGAYVWSQWCAVNGVTDAVDVTETVCPTDTTTEDR